MIDMSLITVPTSEPYDSTHPQRQAENAAYVALQIMTQVKAEYPELDIDLVDAVRSLGFNHASIRWGDIEITLSNTTSTITQF